MDNKVYLMELNRIDKLDKDGLVAYIDRLEKQLREDNYPDDDQAGDMAMDMFLQRARLKEKAQVIL